MSNEDFCNNCGNTGHLFKECKIPKTSYGIICVRKINDEYKFLLIRRRCSLSYIEFMRGRYKIFDANMIFTLFKHMTIQERNDIVSKDFDELWDDLWIFNKYKKTDLRSDYDKGKELYTLLKEGTKIAYQNIWLNLNYILQNTYSIYEEPEWNFPKGRRNAQEKDLESAEREFCEETGLKKKDFKIISDEAFIEIHKGTNNRYYRTVYFLAEFITDKIVNIDKNNKYQVMEISKIGWYNYLETINKFREYDDEKKNVITNVYKKLINKNIQLSSI